MTLETRNVRSGHPRLTKNVAPGIHRLQHANVNCYLVEDGNDVTIIDAAFPSTWSYLLLALKEINRDIGDVRALLLTHGHFDHMGFAARLVGEFSVPAYIHVEDRALAAHPYVYRRERSPLLYPLRYPQAIPVLASMVSAGALFVKGVSDTKDLPASGTFDVPGRPVVIFSPGHTFGHCAFFFPGRDALVTGDALVTLDPYKGRRGFQVIASAATADSEMAISSLTALAQTEATFLLPGHGEPSRLGASRAVGEAREAGVS